MVGYVSVSVCVCMSVCSWALLFSRWGRVNRERASVSRALGNSLRSRGDGGAG